MSKLLLKTAPGGIDTGVIWIFLPEYLRVVIIAEHRSKQFIWLRVVLEIEFGLLRGLGFGFVFNRVEPFLKKCEFLISLERFSMPPHFNHFNLIGSK